MSRRVGLRNINNRTWQGGRDHRPLVPTPSDQFVKPSEILANCVAEEDPMCRHAGRFTVGVLAGAVYLSGSFSFSAMAQAAPPNFAPNASIGWYAYSRIFIPPANGAGPVQQDPAHPFVLNDEFRVTG